ncbi:MAG TPA: serine hydrolase [Gemmatimonadales bacterium]|jgi:CubicO group peptidase (beta-lactamase class C family)|nr:serine hydrolase [Gemmatimonadales bacterium]
MTMTRVALLVLLVGLAPGLCPSAAGQAGPPADLDAYVTRALAAFDTPGAAVAVVKDGRVVLAKGFGVRRLGQRAPVDAHTLFQIASNTKAFTTASLAMLVDEGKLAWDDPVTRHLPWFQLSDAYVTRELTVRDLITHRSGLGLGAGDLLWYHSDYSRDSILRRIRYAKVASSFRSEFAYDNVLYVAAGEVIPAVSGLTWEEFIRRRIFLPLGMTEARLTARGVRPEENFADAHSKVDGRLTVIARDTFDATNAAGGVVANVTDLAKWMIVQLDSGRVRGAGPGDSGRRLWTAERTQEMWSGQTIQPISEIPKSLGDFRPNFYLYGLGWDLRDYRGRKLVSHTGGLDGMTSRTLLVPAERLGIVVVTNGESPLSTAVAWHVLDHYFKAPPTDWITRLADYVRSAEAEAHEVERKAAGARHQSSPSLPLASYAGRYTDQMYGDVTLTEESGRLVLRFSHSLALTGDLEHWQYDTFVAHWRQHNIPDIYVTFALKPDGSIDTMKMAAVSPLADFSYDFQDLLFRPAETRR